MSSLEAELRSRLQRLTADGLERRLVEPSGLDLSSNDYLGLSRHAALAEGVARRLLEARRHPPSPITAPASRLLRGQTRHHRQLEARLAAWKGTEDALLFPSGYQANIGVLSALLQPHDRAISDAENHASLIDGLRLSGCRKVIIPHLDGAALEASLAEPHRGGRTFLVTESLFSMSGDIAPLDRYADLAERHGAALVVDDAHATGLYGDRGSGLVERFGVTRRVAAVVSTAGKALGVGGAFVTGSRVLVRYLISRCRPFIFSTAPPPLVLFALDAALDLLAAEPERRLRVLALADRLRSALRQDGVDCLASEGPIVPVVLGDNLRAVQVAAELQRRGFDARAIRPPTVAPGTARLRLSVHADHREEEIDAVAAAVAQLAGRPRTEAAG